MVTQKHNGRTAMYKKGTTHQYNKSITFTLNIKNLLKSLDKNTALS